MRMKRKSSIVLTAIALGLVTIASQNCSNGGFTSATDSSVDGGSTSPTTPAAAVVTTGGVTLPAGFRLVTSDRFGTAAAQSVRNFAQLHSKYYEAQFYNRDANGLVKIPNVVINQEQQTYSHFEDAIVFATDHLTIQGRGHPDNSITAAEMVARSTARSWCVESKYQIPSADKSWPALWWYAGTAGGDSSEIDIEQPITPNQGVHDVSFHNHPYEYDAITIKDARFTTPYMNWHAPTFDASTAPHVYTTCYDDAHSKVIHWVDGGEIFEASYTWNKSLGGTGFGPDATTIVNLAVGGVWTGQLANPAAYVGDLDLYYVDYFEP